MYIILILNEIEKCKMLIFMDHFSTISRLNIDLDSVNLIDHYSNKPFIPM